MTRPTECAGRDAMKKRSKILPVLLLAVATSACSLKTKAINMVGDALSSGDSVYETDDDIDLVVSALPFGLKLTESLLAQSPNHPGLLLTACRGFVLYSYSYVDYQAELMRAEDLDKARAMRARAGKLYMRAARYGFRALERSHPGFEIALLADPDKAVLVFDRKHKERDVPLLYWTAAALGLSISALRSEAAMLARLPEVEAMLDRALALDESWNAGALHEFKVTLAGAVQSGPVDAGILERHYKRALELSKGTSAGLYVAYAQAVAAPAQNKAEFKALLEKALTVDPDREPRERLATLVAQRRARWLLGRIDDLILEADRMSPGGAR
jgi:predicted anti-sigma-YlaC factor YlaD